MSQSLHLEGREIVTISETSAIQNMNNIYTDCPWQSESTQMSESHRKSSTVVAVVRLSEATAHGMREAGVPAAVWRAKLFHLSSLSALRWCATSSRPARFVKTTERCHKIDPLKLRQSPRHFQSHSVSHSLTWSGTIAHPASRMDYVSSDATSNLSLPTFGSNVITVVFNNKTLKEFYSLLVRMKVFYCLSNNNVLPFYITKAQIIMHRSLPHGCHAKFQRHIVSLAHFGRLYTDSAWTGLSRT